MRGATKAKMYLLSLISLGIGSAEFIHVVLFENLLELEYSSVQ